MFPSVLGESFSHKIPPKIMSEISTYCEIAEPIKSVAAFGEALLVLCRDNVI
jgi:hypothetical protein